MGNQLFGVDIAGIIADAMADGLPTCTIERDVRGARQAGNLTGGRASAKHSFDCTGFWEDFTGGAPAGVVVEANDRKLILIGDTIPAGEQPQRNDAATVNEDDGPVGPLYIVKLLARDPAAATYTYLCRDRRGPDQE